MIPVGTLRAYHADGGQIHFEDFVYAGDEVEVSHPDGPGSKRIEVCKVILSSSGSFILRPLTAAENEKRTKRIIKGALAA